MRTLFLLLLAAAPAAGQIPDHFTNLEVLPDSITRQQLIQVMRGFSLALDVRCWHCHVGEEGQPLSEYDFAADEREPKRVARRMLRMVRAINAEYLADVGGDLTVECFTCHRGAPTPRRLEDALLEAFRAGGGDSLLAAYAGYRDTYYGRAVFDFGPGTLSATAQRLARIEGGVPAAVRVFARETDLHPDYPPGWVGLGNTLAMAGDTTRAIAVLERALALVGSSQQIEQRIQRLRG